MDALFSIIVALEDVDLKVLCTTCDMGPRNVSLANELKITPENVKFQNPFDEARDVFFCYDFTHGMKNLRYIVWVNTQFSLYTRVGNLTG